MPVSLMISFIKLISFSLQACIRSSNFCSSQSASLLDSMN
jgi:hypothetical protein